MGWKWLRGGTDTGFPYTFEGPLPECLTGTPSEWPVLLPRPGGGEMELSYEGDAFDDYVLRKNDHAGGKWLNMGYVGTDGSRWWVLLHQGEQTLMARLITASEVRAALFAN